MKFPQNFIKKILLISIPFITYNPFTNLLHTPFTIKPYSTYVNFKLNETQKAYLEEYIQSYSENFTLIPVKMTTLEPPEFFLSVNIYNCTSPVFANNNKEVTRCEINTYVKLRDKIGTIIMDYCSNGLSLDPVELFSLPKHAIFRKEKSHIVSSIENEKIQFALKFGRNHRHNASNNNVSDEDHQQLSESLISATDNIFYKNGVIDKLFYDSSLSKARIEVPDEFSSFKFRYKDLEFTDIHNVFYFTDEIRFICSLWDNL